MSIGDYPVWPTPPGADHLGLSFEEYLLGQVLAGTATSSLPAHEIAARGRQIVKALLLQFDSEQAEPTADAVVDQGHADPLGFGTLIEEFENGYVPMDEPPGMEEREYARWKASGGIVQP